MIGPHSVEGYAIISANGMIADGNGEMPAAIRNKADQHFLQSELDRAAVVVHGRHSYEGGQRAPRRKRLILTRRIEAIAPDPSRPNAWLWNPAAATPDEAVAALDAPAGPLAILGGTDVFDLFLPLYDAFHLTHAPYAAIPGGRPVFSKVGPALTPDDILRACGLRPTPQRDLDAKAGITLTIWRR